MKIVLLGLEFYIGNKGCEALSYSFVGELDKIASMENVKFEIEAIVMAGGERKQFSEWITDIVLTKIEPKKRSFWKHCRKVFAESDVIFDFSMGDSFSDIYGIKRFIICSALKELAIRSCTPFVLGPQTYGPFQRRWVQKWAASIIKRSSAAYARDNLSQQYVYELCGKNVVQTTDIAFALPYEKKLPDNEACEKLNIGFNVSGLLWQGGYTGNNQFHLKVDYKKYCTSIIQKLLNDQIYDLYLIPHVGNKSKQMMESDYIPCIELKKLFPDIKIIDGGESPSEIKSEIAQMDIFIGARMHATIAAFSSGAATIPFSYSRKFEGLYQSLGYSYVIEALRLTTEEAIELTYHYIQQHEKLRNAVRDSMKIVEQEQQMFRQEIVKILSKCSNGDKR